MRLIENLAEDWHFLRGAVRSLLAVRPITRNPGRTFPDVVADLARKNGDRPALESPGETLSFAGLDARANQWARWARANGVRRGTVVALLMRNRPEYMAIWLGLNRAGGVVALLNTHLVGASLHHCVTIVKPALAIVDAALETQFGGEIPEGDTVWWGHGVPPEGGNTWPRADLAVDALPGADLASSERETLTINDRALLIYTSGTTGVPKAANVDHYRVMAITNAFAAAMQVTPEDRMFDCLPMYHVVGGVLATGATLIGGGTVVIRERFNPLSFWRDVVRERCTLFQYVGELCRFLANAPPSKAEKEHKLRLACGNGLRPDIWMRFKERCNIPEILEFYSATEGNVSLFNFGGKPGSVGRIPRWLEGRLVVRIIKVDPITEQPVRGPDGLCVPCAPGEVGEAIGEISLDPKKPANRFAGYAEKTNDASKTLHDVFRQGDSWFRTGDLMRKDERGWFFFVDRMGDTFRWKGENVATAEVSGALTGFEGISDATVYGVPVPNADGKAGMAAIVAGETIDLRALAAHVDAALPVYARPVFLRLRGELEMTGTFKQRKMELVREGFDPALCGDPLFVRKGVTFVPVDADWHARLQSGETRV